jgi:hypothetical protein
MVGHLYERPEIRKIASICQSLADLQLHDLRSADRQDLEYLNLDSWLH